MYAIYYNDQEFNFDYVSDWNLAIMSYLYDDKNLTAIKDGQGGCVIE